MEKYKFDENNGLWYELQGDYYLPCLKLPEEEQAYIGIWGQRHLRYLKEHRRVRYADLLTSGKLNSYLIDIDRQAEEMFERLVKQMPHISATALFIPAPTKVGKSVDFHLTEYAKPR